MKFTVLLSHAAAAAAAATASPRATPHTAVTNPRPEIGTISGADASNHGCTASIVASPKGNIIVTAAHCVAGKAHNSVYFTPAYNNGRAPHGTWQSTSIHVNPLWNTHKDINGAGSPYDFAFVVLAPKGGKHVAQATGASLKLKIDQALPAQVQVYGYPATSYIKSGSYKDTLYRGASTAVKDGAYWEELQCVGIPGGFSGGPWIAGANEVFGVIGGKGQNLPASDPRNYSVHFGKLVKQLYDTAVAAA